MIDLCLRAGIGSKGMQASRCLNHVCLNNGVVRMRRVGLLKGIPKRAMELLNAKCVSIGPIIAVDFRLISAFVTVERFMCTSSILRVFAVCDTAATARKLLISTLDSLLFSYYTQTPYT